MFFLKRTNEMQQFNQRDTKNEIVYKKLIFFQELLVFKMQYQQYIAVII